MYIACDSSMGKNDKKKKRLEGNMPWEWFTPLGGIAHVLFVHYTLLYIFHSKTLSLIENKNNLRTQMTFLEFYLTDKNQQKTSHTIRRKKFFASTVLIK